MATTQDVKRFMEYRKRCPTAQEYYEKRGISPDLIDEFHLGFCPLNKDHWAKGRIIVPVFDCYGRFLDFAGRKIRDEDSGPKWENGTFAFTPIGSTEKGHHLYNLNKAKYHILEKQYAIVTEGYFDVITAWKYGLKNTVATCGTSFTYTHLCLLMRYCELLVFVYDADESGQVASRKIRNEFSGNIGIINIELEEGYDLDEYLKSYGVESFNELLNDRLEVDKLEG